MKTTIGIAVIHNNNLERNKILFPNVEKLVKALENRYNVKYIKISLQPPIEDVSLLGELKKLYIFWHTERDWAKYRLLKRNIIIDFLMLLKRTLNLLKKKNKKMFIYSIVTDKHIRAWDSLYEECDLILIFEDDSIFKDDSIERFLILLEDVIHLTYKDYIYVDLAGGCSYEELEVSKLEISRDDKYINFRKPVTNTACAYLLNKKILSLFKYILIKFPEIRLLPIDWMMNKIFIELYKKQENLNIKCIHLIEPIYNHGSCKNEFISWTKFVS